MATVLALVSVAVLLALAAAGIALARRPFATRVIYGGTMGVALVLLAIGLVGLFGGDRSSVVLALGLPWIGAHFALDPLSAVFMVVVNLGAVAATLYGLGYGRHETEPARVLPFVPMFIAGMNLVVLAADAFTFLISWEFMSLSSWALVMSHHHDPENRRAGLVYIIMASLGTFALLLAFGLLAGTTGGYAFDVIRASEPSHAVASWVLVLALVGAGSKAGLVPLHAWLPLAHPAAPSHVSALMSGVMTKVAIYGLIRIVFDLLGPGDSWWAILFLVVGGVTAVIGVLFASMERDLKRLLAYSTVENIGIITIGLGLALAFRANAAAPAALALTAALIHVVNHTLFKSLLFLGAGAVLTATGQRNIERLGGLIHRMPLTAVCFLVGSLAIAALPPLNGFVSEWLTFQAMLLSPDLPDWGLKLLIPAMAAVLALAAALAAVCFTRAFGIAFLSRPRGAEAAQAREVDRLSVAAMIGLAGLCVLAGIFPTLLIGAVSPAVESLVGARMPAGGAAFLSIVPIAEGRSSYNGLLVFLFIAAAGLLAAFAIHRLASRSIRRAPAWDCGYPDPSPATQYTAASFAQPIRRVFGSVIMRAKEKVEMPPPGSVAPAVLSVSVRDLVWDVLYAPVAGTVGAVAGALNRFQFLTIRRYLLLVFSTLIVLLAVLAVVQ